MSFRRYPAHKNASMNWWASLPLHWAEVPLRALARPGRDCFVDGDWIEAPYITDKGIRLIQTGNVGVGWYKEQGFRFISEVTFHSLRCTEVMPGDVLICRLAEPVGRACLAPDLDARMITSVDVCIMKPSEETAPAFIVYLLSCPEYLGFMEGQCRGGTRDRVSRSFLGNIRVPVPPLAEQMAIVAFLDRETAKIDALVDEQKRLIELLKEKRQAVISHTVTKGLDPNAPMKDSGVEWLGQVPEHWGVAKVKHVTNALTSGPRGWSELISVEGTLFVQSQNIGTAMEIDLAEVSRVSVPDNAETRRSQLLHDDVVVCITGGRTGAVAHVGELPDAAYINQHICLLRREERHVNGRFLAYALFSPLGQQQLEVASYGLKQGLSLSNVSDLWICVPPRTEQKEIVAGLDTTLARLSNLQQHSEKSVAILQERRSALISAAVTGKIDVRGVAAEIAEAAA